MVRLTSLLLPGSRWQDLHWRLTLVLPLVSCACASRAPDWPGPHHGGQTQVSFPAGVPSRLIDILFVIGNSPSMAPKQAVLAQNFRKMIAVLERLPGGSPEVHIGVVSSNMGAGMGAMGGNCGAGLGDRGLLWGNDPNDLTASVAPGSAAAQDPNNPIVDGCGLLPGARWIEDVARPDGEDGRQRNYSGRAIEDVFTCLATAVGSNGCEEQHLLQATRVALIPQNSINEANSGFLRSYAYLFIVLVTDQDDCSANNYNTLNDDMFNMVTKGDPGDTTTLRCAARGHLCGGQPIPDYDPVVGYTGTTPFSHTFADCSAKEKRLLNPNGNPDDPNNVDYVYLPLIDVQEMIDSVNWVKGAAASQKILVSGIIGWPPGPNDVNLPATLQTSNQYQIGKDATSLPVAQQSLWDYMPVCSIPDQKSTDGNIYKAYGGLRLKKFIDAFGDKGQTFSICNSDFTEAMVQVGEVGGNDDVLWPGCIDAPLIDTDPNTPEIEPDCQVFYQTPCTTLGTGYCQQTGWAVKPLSECKDAQGKILDPASLDPSLSDQQTVDNLLANISQDSRPCWYLSYDNTALGCRNVSYKGQEISALRPSGSVAAPGTILAVTCLTELATGSQ
jgi:hypothetical protein